MTLSRLTVSVSNFRSRDGTVLPPTLTSRRLRQATVSVVDMSLAMDIDVGGLGLPRHHQCYDEQVTPRMRHGTKRSRRRRSRRHDNDDDVERMDTVDQQPVPLRYLRHMTDDVTTLRDQNEYSYRRTRQVFGRSRNSRFTCYACFNVSLSLLLPTVLLLRINGNKSTLYADVRQDTAGHNAVIS